MFGVDASGDEVSTVTGCDSLVLLYVASAAWRAVLSIDRSVPSRLWNSSIDIAIKGGVWG